MTKFTTVIITFIMLGFSSVLSLAYAEAVSVKLLQTMANAGKKDLNVPKKLDEETIVTDIIPATNRLIYHYTLIKYNSAELQSDSISQIMRPSLTKNYCTNPDLAFFKNNSVDIEHIYFGKDDIVVSAILIARSDCQ